MNTKIQIIENINGALLGGVLGNFTNYLVDNYRKSGNFRC
jgi:hypothetical protein